MKAKTLLIVVVAALLTVLAVPVTSTAAFAMESVTGIEILHNDRISEFDEAVLEDTVVLIYDDSPDMYDPLEEENVEDCYALILYKEEGLVCKNFFITGAMAVSDSDLQLAYDKAIEIRTRLNEISIGMEDILPPPDAGQDVVEFPIQIGDGDGAMNALSRCVYEEYTFILSNDGVLLHGKYGYINLDVVVSFLDVGEQRLFFVETHSQLSPGGAVYFMETDYNERSETKEYGLTITAPIVGVGIPTPHLSEYWPKTEPIRATITSGYSESNTLGSTYEINSGVSEADGFAIGANWKFEATTGTTYSFNATYDLQIPKYRGYIRPGDEGQTVYNGAGWHYYTFFEEDAEDENGNLIGDLDARKEIVDLYNGVMIEAQKINSQYDIDFDIELRWLMMTPGLFNILDEYALERTITVDWVVSAVS